VAGDLGVALPTWVVAALVALPVLDVLHSFSPWSHRLWVEEDHTAWTTFWGTVVGLRWAQAAIAAAVLVVHDASFADAGLRSPSTPVLAGSLLLAAAAAAWYVAVAARTPTVQPSDAPNDISTTYPANGRERVLWFVSGGLTAGVCEEFVYRGAVFAALLGAGLPLPAAALVAALAFAGAHGFAALNPVALAVYVGYALVATGIVVATGSLLPAMAVHATWNLVAATRDLRSVEPDAADAATA
jgi:membrane protease YdiL (CAAX protease family)